MQSVCVVWASRGGFDDYVAYGGVTQYNSTYQDGGAFMNKMEISCKLAPQCKYSAFRQSIRADPEITLSGTTLSTLEMADLIAEIRDPATRLSVLMLSGLKLSKDAIKGLCYAFSVNQSIQVLQIMQDKLGDEGATLIADALQRNSSIEKLSLRGNGINEEGIAHIANALKINSSIQMLSLADNVRLPVLAPCMSG